MGQTCQPLGGPRYFGHHAFLAATFRAIKIQIYSRTPLALKCREIVHSVARMASAPRLGRQFLGVLPVDVTVGGNSEMRDPHPWGSHKWSVMYTPHTDRISVTRTGRHSSLKSWCQPWDTGGSQRATGGATCTHGWPGRGVCSLSERPGFLCLLTYLRLGQPSSPISILDFSFIPREDTYPPVIYHDPRFDAYNHGGEWSSLSWTPM